MLNLALLGGNEEMLFFYKKFIFLYFLFKQNFLFLSRVSISFLQGDAFI